MEIIPIPPLPDNPFAPKRVAAYVRVSTQHEEQQTSLDLQKSYFREHIESRFNWHLVDIYAEAATGTNINQRPELQRLLHDARNHLIDLILVKSISRFSRNALDLLAISRELRELNVEIYFEQEHLSSFNPNCEQVLSIFSALAQEESRNLSENIRWGIVHNMEKGIFNLPYKHFLGYRKGPNGKPEIVKSEAKIIQKIYHWFLVGASISRIVTLLEEKHIYPPGGGNKWHWSTIRSILTNEKYKGEALLQKTYTPDYLSHKTVPNRGEIRKYYVSNSHPAIIDPETWELVQEKLKEDKNVPNPQ